MKIIETTPKTNNMSKDTWIHLYKRFNELGNPQLSALKDFLEAPFQMVFSGEEIHEQKVYDQYMGKADVIVPIVNEAITNYGTINHRVLGNIYREHIIG